MYVLTIEVTKKDCLKGFLTTLGATSKGPRTCSAGTPGNIFLTARIRVVRMLSQVACCIVASAVAPGPAPEPGPLVTGRKE